MMMRVSNLCLFIVDMFLMLRANARVEKPLAFQNRISLCIPTKSTIL